MKEEGEQGGEGVEACWRYAVVCVECAFYGLGGARRVCGLNLYLFF